MEGPDHKSSLEPAELTVMVSAIRDVQKALGNGVKNPSLSEIKNKMITRKSVVAVRNIKKGELLTEKNITTKRPAAGISPMKWDTIINTPAKRDFRRDDIIEL
jgi:N,N'-diacetyllegionaminate synthase